MAGRTERERVIREIYDARIRGDVDGILAHVHPGISFAIAGCPASSAVPCSVTGQDALRDLMGQLIATFEFRNNQVIDTMIDGDRAVVHWRVQVRAPASGQEAETEIVDLIEFAGDKVLSFKQFADTALAARLLASNERALAQA
jgi:ketosteroid isomerase-like protein